MSGETISMLKGSHLLRFTGRQDALGPPSTSEVIGVRAG
jgi:hypothetical protein